MKKNAIKKSIIEYLLLAWIGLLFFLYIYHYSFIFYFNYKNIPLFFAVLSGLIFIIILILTIIYGPRKKIQLKNLQNILSFVGLAGKIFSFSLTKVIAFFYVSTILLANIATITITKVFFTTNISDLIFFEVNIIQKISVLFLFYICLILFIYALGRKILELSNFNFDKKGELFIFSIGIGFAVIMLGTFALAILGKLYAKIIWTILFLITILLWSTIKKIIEETKNTKLSLSFKNYYASLKSLFFLILFFFLITSFIFVIKPTTQDNDSLNVYFNAPWLYVHYHKYIPITNYMHASMGQNMEMIYTLIMTIFSSAFIVHLPLFFWELTLLGFYFLLKQIFGERHALLGLLTIYFLPVNFLFIHSTKVDLPLMFYSVLMLYSLFIWHKKRCDKFLYLMGIFSGIALGIKYNAAFLIVPLFIFASVLFLYTTKNFQQYLKVYIVAIFLVILLFSPWAIKNKIYFNNIFHPYTFLNQGEVQANYFVAPSDFKNYEEKRYGEVAYLKHFFYSQRSIKNFLKMIWYQSIGKNTVNSLSSNFGFACLLIIPFYFLINNRKINILITIPILYFILWYFIAHGERWYAYFGYLMFYSLMPSLFLYSKKFLYFYLPIMITLTIYFAPLWPLNLQYLISQETKQSFIEKKVPYYKVAKYINKLNLLDSKKKIIILGDFKSAYINNNDKIIVDIDPYLIKFGYNINKNGEDYYYNLLKKNSIKYIIYSQLPREFFQYWPLWHRLTLVEYKEQYHGDIPSLYKDIDKLEIFLNNKAKLIFKDEVYSLYQLN